MFDHHNLLGLITPLFVMFLVYPEVMLLASLQRKLFSVFVGRIVAPRPGARRQQFAPATTWWMRCDEIWWFFKEA
jgi:hypothetical protein